jgi:hypothetical protein
LETEKALPVTATVKHTEKIIPPLAIEGDRGDDLVVADLDTRVLI